MSKMEPTEYLNDRYTAMEERLAVSRRGVREVTSGIKPTLRLPTAAALELTVVFRPLFLQVLTASLLHSIPPETDRPQAPQPPADAGRKGE